MGVCRRVPTWLTMTTDRFPCVSFRWLPNCGCGNRSFLRTGWPNRRRRGQAASRCQCAESNDDVRVPAIFHESIQQARAMDRHCVRERAAEEFNSTRVVDSVIVALRSASPKVSQFADVRRTPWRKELLTD